MTRPSGNRASHVSRLGSRLRESYDRSVAVPVVTIAPAPAPAPIPTPAAKQELVSPEPMVEVSMAEVMRGNARSDAPRLGSLVSIFLRLAKPR
jgi:hypothetical protein